MVELNENQFSEGLFCFSWEGTSVRILFSRYGEFFIGMDDVAPPMDY